MKLPSFHVSMSIDISIFQVLVYAAISRRGGHTADFLHVGPLC